MFQPCTEEEDILLLQGEADKEKEREMTPDEIGRKIASQWTTDPDAAGSGSASGTEEEELQEEDEEEDSAVEDDHEVILCHLSCRDVISSLIS